MKLKRLVMLAGLALMLAALGLGVNSIYALFFRSELPGCTAIEVHNGDIFIGKEEEMHSAFAELLNALCGRAREEGCFMLLNDYRNAGVGVINGAAFLKTVLTEGEAADGEPPGVYFTGDDAAYGSCVYDGVLEPRRLAVPVIGRFDKNANAVLRGKAYIFPLGMCAYTTDFTLYCDTADPEALAEMIGTYGYNSKYSASIVYRPVGLPEGIGKAFADESGLGERRYLAVGTLALALTGGFFAVLIVEDGRKRLVLKHIFGLSFARAVLDSALAALAVVLAGLALLIGFAAYTNAFAGYTARDVITVLGAAAAIGSITALAALTVGGIGLRSAFGGRQ